jgi:hypothetical protein
MTYNKTTPGKTAPKKKSVRKPLKKPVRKPLKKKKAAPRPSSFYSFY